MRGILHTNNDYIKRATTTDNFYHNPDSIRQFALSQMYYNSTDYIGYKTTDTFLFNDTKEAFELILGAKIKDWENPENGRFESYQSSNHAPVTWDKQYDWTGYIFLSPDPSPETGITLHRHKNSKSFVGSKDITFNPLDKFQFDNADVLGNIYNRLVLIDGSILRSYSEFFGWDIPSGMLVQTFKFNVRR
jgi:hypothetical protein